MPHLRDTIRRTRFQGRKRRIRPAKEAVAGRGRSLAAGFLSQFEADWFSGRNSRADLGLTFRPFSVLWAGVVRAWRRRLSARSAGTRAGSRCTTSAHSKSSAHPGRLGSSGPRPDPPWAAGPTTHALATGEPDDRETITSGSAGGRAGKDRPRSRPLAAWADPTAWPGTCRRPFKDYEDLGATSENVLYFAMDPPLLHRLAQTPPCLFSDSLWYSGYQVCECINVRSSTGNPGAKK